VSQVKKETDETEEQIPNLTSCSLITSSSWMVGLQTNSSCFNYDFTLVI